MIRETEEDRKRERLIGERFAEEWGYHFGRKGELSPFDGYLFRKTGETAKDKQPPYSQVVAEIKSFRRQSWDKFDEMFIDLHKFQHLLCLEAVHCIPALYLTEFEDRLVYQRIAVMCGMKRRLGCWGRDDRPDEWSDVKPAMAFAKKVNGEDQFKFLAKGATLL